MSEAHLVECFESVDGCLKSCLHVIAAMSDTEEATKLCRQLMQKIKNALNREYLLYTRTVDEFDMNTWTVRARVAAIHMAAYSGNSGLVRLLCQECGVDPNCSTSETLEEKPKKGITALEWAARKGHVEVVKVLLDNKANVNASRPTNGVTPLWIAAQEGHVEVVKLLLDNEADVNVSRHSDGDTPLFVAAQNGHLKVVKLLLDNKADVNAGRLSDGATSLFMVAHNGHEEVVKLLLANKANVNARLKRSGEKPIDAARRSGHLDIVKLLL